LPQPAEDEFADPFGGTFGEFQCDNPTHRVGDDVDGVEFGVGQYRCHVVGQLCGGVGGGVVGFAAVAVAAQVDANGAASGAGQHAYPAGTIPVQPGVRGEPVDQQHRVTACFDVVGNVVSAGGGDDVGGHGSPRTVVALADRHCPPNSCCPGVAPVMVVFAVSVTQLHSGNRQGRRNGSGG